MNQKTEPVTTLNQTFQDTDNHCASKNDVDMQNTPNIASDPVQHPESKYQLDYNYI